MRKKKKNPVFVTFVTLFVLSFATWFVLSGYSIITQKSISIDEKISPSQEINNNIDLSKNHQYLAYNGSTDPLPIPEFPPLWFKTTVFPPYFELIPNFCQKNDGWARTVVIPVTEVCINSDGLRDKEYSIEKDEGTFRIIGLGDAVTFGQGVNNNETWTSFLENDLNSVQFFGTLNNNYEVINFGFPSWNTKKEIQMFELKGLKYKPDLVILQYMENDAQDLDLINKLRVKYIAELKKEIPEHETAFVIASAQTFLDERALRKSLPLNEEMKIVENHLDILKKLSEENNFKVVIVHYSTLFSKRHLEYMRNITLNKYDWYFMESDISTIKGIEREDIALDPTDFYINSFGYELTSNQILDFLLKNPEVFNNN